MPSAFTIGLSGRVQATADRWGTFRGDVVNVDNPAATFTGSVSRLVADSWAAPEMAVKCRVKLNGEWIPEADLLPPRLGVAR